jgi:glycosyltransferase involved in cell wall biosynthesis
MKIAVLWTELSGYLNACLKELASRKGVELFVAHQLFKEDAPFDQNQFGWIKNQFTWRLMPESGPLERELLAFQPDILVVLSWNKPAYRRVAAKLATKCWRVLAMDNCWRGTLKQRLGVFAARYYVKPLADAVWLPGERQAVFASKLGFAQTVILRGSLSCDQPALECAYRERVEAKHSLPHSFIYVGRFAPEKGLDVLAKAYSVYRSVTTEPWPLLCYGAGPLRGALEGKPGIEVKGFVQPDHLSSVLSSAGCLILPSRAEAWGVVLHEAASAGIPILASDRVGGVAHLVQPNYNGFIFDSQDVEGLATLMTRVSAMSDERLNTMSRASHMLSQQFSPRGWADTLLESYQAWSRINTSGSAAN